MNYLNIPYFGYFGSQNMQLNLQICLSDEIYNTFKSAEAGVKYQEQDLTDTSAPVKANNWFKTNGLIGNDENIFNIKTTLYSVRKSDTPAESPYIAIKNVLNIIGLAPTELRNDIDSTVPNPALSPNGDNLYPIVHFGDIGFNNYRASNGHYNSVYVSNNVSTGSVEYELTIFPTDVFVNDIFVCPDDMVSISIVFNYTYDNVTGDITKIQKYTIYVLHPATKSQYEALFRDFNLKNSSASIQGGEDPYSSGIEGNSGIGGGDGKKKNPDELDPVDIPDLPDISAADLGFCTIYSPTKSQLKALSDFMWSNLFDLNTYKKLFSDPMESIIGLAIVPVEPSIGGSKNVMFGSIDSGISMSYCSTQYVQKDCGWVDIDKYIGCFLDAAPYTKVSIYLPFIGIHQLSADDVVGGSIRVVYNIDVLSGACSAFIQHDTRGVLYSYNGSCISNIPLTSVNFSTAIQNAVSAVCSGAAVVAGISTGAAPITGMGAMGLLNSAANTALNSKPDVQRSGSLGGSAGIMSVLTPYVIIERPDISIPAGAPSMIGQVSNITFVLGQISGFTMVEYIHIENCEGTADEIKEIEALLKEGVYL